MVMYNGAMLDIASMLQRLDKSEKLKLETDANLKDIEEEMGERRDWNLINDHMFRVVF